MGVCPAVNSTLRKQYNGIYERGSNSVVECLPSKQGVAGSNPVSRSIPSSSKIHFGSRRNSEFGSFFGTHDRSGLRVGFAHVSQPDDFVRSGILRER